MLIRWRLTLRLVPSVWANRLTRSSSSSQRASVSTASRSASGAAAAERSRASATMAVASATWWARAASWPGEASAFSTRSASALRKRGRCVSCSAGVAEMKPSKTSSAACSRTSWSVPSSDRDVWAPTTRSTSRRAASVRTTV